MRLHRWIVILAARVVPKSLRRDWRAEWDAELDHQERRLREWQPAGGWLQMDLLRRSAGAIWDALLLQSGQWHSLRLFERHWRLAVAAVLSLSTAFAAVVIGAAAYNALLLRPPGVKDPDSLQFIHVRTASEPFGPASFDEFTYYRAHARAFSDVAAFPYSIATADLTSDVGSEHVLVTQVSDNYFSVLGITGAVGSLSLGSSPADDGAEIVISRRLWTKLGGSRGLIGASVRLNDQPVVVLGVAPPTVTGMTLIWDPDVWMSFKAAEKVLGSDPSLLTDRRQRWLHMIGRLRRGMSQTQAAADVTLLSADVSREHPESDAGRVAFVTDVSVTPPGDRGWMSMLLGGLGLIVLLALIVACANVTNLLLGLATARRHEMLVRAALGASRLQLAAPLLRESLLLCGVSGILGFGAAFVVLAKLATFRLSLGPFPSPSLDVRPDVMVIGVTLALAVAAGLAVGLAPAWRAAQDGLSGAINRELSIGEPRKARVRSVLVVIQMAVAALVMVGLGVAVRSFVSLERAPLGFSARHLAYASVNLARSGYTEATGRQFYQRIRERVAALPGVEAVTLADSAPLAGAGRDSVRAEGGPTSANDGGTQTSYAVVGDQYFATIGIGLTGGRLFDSRDRIGGPEVVVINATLARQLWPQTTPVGRRIRVAHGDRVVQVIGVVQDSKYEDVTEDPSPFMYFALAQRYEPALTVIVRSSGEHVPGADAIMRALFDLDPNIVGTGFLTLDDLLRLSLLLPRTIAITATVFGLLTLGLAVLGLYSTVFYSVSQRKAEMAIRSALGAGTLDIFAAVLRHTVWVAVIGTVLGLGAGLALLPLASSIFFGIGAVEPGVVGTVALTSMLVALATTYVVARPWTRMASIDILRR